MFIKAENCALRALEPHDATTLYQWENDRRLWSYSFTTAPFSKFVLEEFANLSHQDIYATRQLRLMICNTVTSQALGCVDIFDFDPQHSRCGIGVFVETAQRGKGIAQQALEMAISYAFDTLLLHQVYAEVSERNVDSLRLFEKCGFTVSGTKQQWHRVGLQQFENVVLLQCLNPAS